MLECANQVLSLKTPRRDSNSMVNGKEFQGNSEITRNRDQQYFCRDSSSVLPKLRQLLR